jgi:hypothetical protein
LLVIFVTFLYYFNPCSAKIVWISGNRKLQEVAASTKQSSISYMSVILDSCLQLSLMVKAKKKTNLSTMAGNINVADVGQICDLIVGMLVSNSVQSSLNADPKVCQAHLYR